MKGVGGGISKKIYGPPPVGRKDRDEDLLLFKEIHRREKDRLVSLLQPVSEDFEPNGNYPLQRVESGKKGSSGYEFFVEMSGKNDYDWLKTPPATPLFPSLEMEANAPDLMVQREITVLQPLSRFADSAVTKESNGISKSPPNPKPRAPPPRSTTPGQRPTIQTTQTKPMPNQKITQLSTDRLNVKGSTATTTSTPAIMKPLNLQHKENQKTFLGLNLSKSTGPLEAKSKPKSRGVSPSVRSIIPFQIPGFSDQTTPNLRTDRPSSTSRGRPGIGNQTVTSNVRQRTESTPKTRRQSCSPSVARGRKVEANQDTATATTNAGSIESNGIIGKKGKFQTGNNGGQVLGSRMVDKFMNARKASVEDKETKAKFRGSINEITGFGRLNSSDVALKHMDVKREPANFQRAGIAARRR